MRPARSGSTLTVRLTPTSPPTPVRRKPKRQIDRREVGGRDDDEQREAAAAVGRHPRRDEADGLQREALEVELHDAGVLAVGRVVEQVAAAAHDLGVDDQADAARAP